MISPRIGFFHKFKDVAALDDISLQLPFKPIAALVFIGYFSVIVAAIFLLHHHWSSGHISIAYLLALFLVIAFGLGIMVYIQSMTRRIEALLLDLKHFQRLTEASGDAMLQVSAEGVCEYASPAALNIAGHTPMALMGRNLSDFIHPDDVEYVRSQHGTIIRQNAQSAVFEYRAKLEQGGWKWLETHSQLMMDAGGKRAVLSIIRDVSHRKIFETELQKAANTDQLTGLPNRGRLMQLMEETMTVARQEQLSFCVGMIDVDFFKAINDSHGHSVGDQALRMISARCEGKLRSPEVCGRFGGEEFVTLLPRVNIDAAHKIFERLRTSIEEESFHIGGQRISITVSIGVAQWQQTESIEQLMFRADSALYEAKHNGRNQTRLAI
jgi:diguanylate cyclase (GGDEF)-like protein/PAS domain S-box-containing protein